MAQPATHWALFNSKQPKRANKHYIVTSIGFKLHEQRITITGTALRFDVVLKQEPNELTAVTITAGSFEASDTKRTTVLNSIDIVTTASANADVTGAIKTLPGAAAGRGERRIVCTGRYCPGNKSIY